MLRVTDCVSCSVSESSVEVLCPPPPSRRHSPSPIARFIRKTRNALTALAASGGSDRRAGRYLARGKSRPDAIRRVSGCQLRQRIDRYPNLVLLAYSHSVSMHNISASYSDSTSDILSAPVLHFAFTCSSSQRWSSFRLLAELEVHTHYRSK